MSYSGIQTLDFLSRCDKFAQDLPPLLLELGQMLRHMIQEIEQPQVEDVQRLQAELRRKIGTPSHLRDICGAEGRLCSQCPFGAYLPSGFAYASEQQPLCLPWIVMTQAPSSAGADPDAA
jgi:hypothetical protein